MSSVFSSAFFFLLTLGTLITFHEFGHYWVARRLGVKVLRFSVGFGKPIWSKRHGSDGTEYSISLLPLGGYVKMLDEREGPVDPAELHRTFNRQSLGRRAAIVAAGPAFNFVLACLLYWIVFIVGVAGVRPIIGGVGNDSLAAHAGLHAGDEITAIAGTTTPTWTGVVLALLDVGLSNPNVVVDVIDERGIASAHTLELSGVADDLNQGDVLNVLGLQPAKVILEPVVGQVETGGAAFRAGLQAGDRVVSADGKPVLDWSQWVEYVRSKPGQTINVEIMRDGANMMLAVTPIAVTTKDVTHGRIGAAVLDQPKLMEKYMVMQRYGAMEALGQALSKTWNMTEITLRLLVKMVVGDISLTNLSGPLSIAQYAGGSASIGLAAFLGFLAVVSVSLGVLNLLPIPVLDGGHLMFYLAEWIKGSPVSQQTEMIGQRIGMALILVMMVFAFYNDLSRIFG